MSNYFANPIVISDDSTQHKPRPDNYKIPADAIPLDDTDTLPKGANLVDVTPAGILLTADHLISDDLGNSLRPGLDRKLFVPPLGSGGGGVPVNPGDLISSDTPNSIVPGSDGKLIVHPVQSGIVDAPSDAIYGRTAGMWRQLDLVDMTNNQLKVDAIDEILSTSAQGTMATVHLGYDASTNTLSLTGKDGAVIDSVPLLEYRLLTNVEVITDPVGQDPGTYLAMSFKLDDGSVDTLYVDMAPFFAAISSTNKMIYVNGSVLTGKVDSTKGFEIGPNGVTTASGYGLYPDADKMKLASLNTDGIPYTNGNNGIHVNNEQRVICAVVDEAAHMSINQNGISVSDGFSFIDNTTLSSVVDVISNTTDGIPNKARSLLNPVTVGGVIFDGSFSISLPGVDTPGTQDTSGNAYTATKLLSSQTIQIDTSSVNTGTFDGSSGVTVGTPVVTPENTSNTTLPPTTTTSLAAWLQACRKNLAWLVERFDGSGYAKNSRNADTATALQTPQTISLSGDVSGTSNIFDGTTDAIINATCYRSAGINVTVVRSGSDTSFDFNTNGKYGLGGEFKIFFVSTDNISISNAPPVNNNQIILETYSNIPLQRARTRYNVNEIYERTQLGGVWQAWQNVSPVVVSKNTGIIASCTVYPEGSIKSGSLYGTTITAVSLVGNVYNVFVNTINDRHSPVVTPLTVGAVTTCVEPSGTQSYNVRFYTIDGSLTTASFRFALLYNP